MTDKETELHTRINYRSALQKWATITAKSLQESAGKRKYKLEKSVSHSVMLTNSVKSFTFQYSLYGMFVDMNVGKGRPLGAHKEAALEDKLLGKKRRRKSKKEYMWYTKPMYRHVQALSRIVAAEYGDLGANAYKLPEVIELTM